jgi:hypothetical protein
MQAIPTISVVISSYEHGAYIRECINSVLEQSWQDFEIIITDDGSSDNTVEEIRSFKDPRIQLSTFKENLGAAIATNYGISRAKGKYIAILNSDDCFAPKKLETQIQFLQQHPNIGAVFGWPTLINEQGKPFEQSHHKEFEVFEVKNRPPNQWLQQFFDHGNCLCHPTVMIRKSCYEAVGLYDARLAQVPDLDMWVRLSMQFQIHVLPEIFTYFRIRDNLQNASARKLPVLVRDAWERRQILRHFLQLSPEQCAEVFPEFSDRENPSVAQFLGQRALKIGQDTGLSFFQDFALEALYGSLPPYPCAWENSDTRYRAFHQLTGNTDLYHIAELLR